MSAAPPAPSCAPAAAALGGRRAVLVFSAFALAYFLSTLIRAITATLSPTLTQEFALDAGDLGLLAAGYFLGFALTQLPLGRWLDRHDPRRVELAFLGLAVAGCLLFSFAQSFGVLLLARVLTGVGVSACLMAPLTGYRRWFTPAMQLRSASWMLMVGSSGVVAATLPVQWLLPLVGWRPLFWLLAAGVGLAMAGIAWAVPRGAAPATAPAPAPAPSHAAVGGDAAVWRSPFFRSVVPLGFFFNGGLAALQTLWIVPWLIRVGGRTPQEAAEGLFAVSLTLLACYWLWGLANPWLLRRGWTAPRLMALLLPLNLAVLAAIWLLGPQAGVGLWVLYGMSATPVSLAQPAAALALPPALAGRALSAYNLAVFVGIFTLQWGVGLLIDLGLALGQPEPMAFRLSLAVFWACSVGAYLFFLWARPYDRPASLPAS
ncbi:MFS transporter [Xenophilus sp. Marseille-Q4582]|uniref:MFS transporter n=1 Tax=Xenophilus sp. Marseille-Q4582 TaxID=2866600 RepID=UPI001CE41E33|nr:MFS transporter [Xenophilus sp. Marseille-Q4582]